jgi:tripartite-type tricarboxylate transporter receptor subunit TctC
MPQSIISVSRILVLGLAAWSACTPAAAQIYPSRTITIVLGYAAGGQADVLARKIGQQLSDRLKTSVVVENRLGGNTLVASQSVVRSAPDGHTLLLVTDAMSTIDPQVPGGSGFNPLDALDFVINLATAPLFLAARKDLPADSLEALIEYGKKNPTALSFGTSGATTPHRIAGEMIKQRGGFQMAHVAYRGTSASVNDLAGGHIALAIGASTALVPMVDAGKIKLLGVTSKNRFALLPTVPAISETLPGFGIISYMGFAVTKSTPPSVTARLNEEINKVLSTMDVREFLEKQGMEVAGGSAEAFKARIAVDFEARGRIIRDMKLAAE